MVITDDCQLVQAHIELAARACITAQTKTDQPAQLDVPCKKVKVQCPLPMLHCSVCLASALLANHAPQKQQAQCRNLHCHASCYLELHWDRPSSKYPICRYHNDHHSFAAVPEAKRGRDGVWSDDPEHPQRRPGWHSSAADLYDASNCCQMLLQAS